MFDIVLVVVVVVVVVAVVAVVAVVVVVGIEFRTENMLIIAVELHILVLVAKQV